MNKNKTEESPLPEKVVLKKSSKNLEDVKEKVEALHQKETKITTKTSKKKTNVSNKKKESIKEENVRITIDLPKSLHKKLKLYAVMNEITIREYVLGILDKSLKNR